MHLSYHSKYFNWKEIGEYHFGWTWDIETILVIVCTLEAYIKFKIKLFVRSIGSRLFLNIQACLPRAIPRSETTKFTCS